MEFEVGDKVKLVRIDNENERYKKYLGEIFTVSRVYRDYVDVEEGQEDSIMPFKKNLELVEYTYEDLRKSPIGTKVTYEDGEVFIKIGMNTYSKEISTCISEVRNYDDMSKDRIIKVEEPKYSTFYERKEEILDKAEKRYLRGVIRPFKDKVKYIKKYFSCTVGKEYLQVKLEEDRPMNLPYFEVSTMYKGMKRNKEYSLEELGL